MMSQRDTEIFLTVRQVAERLQVSVRTVWRWLRPRKIANGDPGRDVTTKILKARRFGRSVRISEQDLADFIQQN
jgi:excisionase family DNA binding protein